MNNKHFYITTTIPYVNAAPHIGFALEITQADALARYKRLTGSKVFFNFGVDEHGQKIWQKAIDEGKTPQEYTDEYAITFDKLKDTLNLSYDAFIRTTSKHHKEAAQEMWRLCKASGDIYKKNYQIKYCVGCELEKTDSELINSECPLHPGKELELRDEENYFFRLSKYQDQLKDLYAKRELVVPDYRLNEIRSLIDGHGLQDFSISRSKAKMPWGVEVPDDDEHVMYVWFDALVNYISTLGWPTDKENFEKYWDGTSECVQVAGKDQVRQQACMWQAMLISANLPHTGKIFIHGFITSGGQKMSKSLGNVIEPIHIVEEYGADALRYFLLKHIHPTEDSDFTMGKFLEGYNADLANGVGNLTARIMKLSEDHLAEGANINKGLGLKDLIRTTAYESQPFPNNSGFAELVYTYKEALENFEFNRGIDLIWSLISNLDSKMTAEKPFSVIKENVDQGKKLIAECVQDLYKISVLLEPFMPETSKKIKTAILENKKPETLFPRKA